MSSSADLDWQPALALREPWRAVTAAFVHVDGQHLAVNLLGLGIVGAWGWAARAGPGELLAWLIAWPLTHLALLVQPTLTHYAGLSGVLHAGVAVAAVHLTAAERGRRRWIGVAVLVGEIAKVLGEGPWQGPTVHREGWSFAIAPIAHASGLACGIVCALLVETMRCRSRG